VAHFSRAALLILIAAPVATSGVRVTAQPNPYHIVEGWLHAPEGKKWGPGMVTTVGPDGALFAMDRCSGETCLGSSEAPIYKFDRSGNLVKNWGKGMFVWPHGLTVDRLGNVWVTDGKADGAKGQQVFKFDAEGNVVMTLGRAGVSGIDEATFNAPNCVAIANNGDIFITEGHSPAPPGPQMRHRVSKFSKDGRFIKEWGRNGSGPGEFASPGGPHSCGIDSRGRLFVGDPYRIQIFDLDGKLLEEWTQFGWPTGMFITPTDGLYTSNVASDPNKNPAAKPVGIYVGSTKDGRVTAYVPIERGHGGESLTADAQGNIYYAAHGIVKYANK
jgi:DNA-binding beta-propeller fold protein YncE